MGGVASGTLRPVTVRETDVPHIVFKKIIQDCLLMKAEARPTFIEIEERLSAVLKELKEAEQKTKKLVLEESIEPASNN